MLGVKYLSFNRSLRLSALAFVAAVAVGCSAKLAPFTQKQIDDAQNNFTFEDTNPAEGVVSGDVKFETPSSVKLKSPVTDLQVYILSEPSKKPELSALVGEVSVKDFESGVLGSISEMTDLDQKLYLYLKDSKSNKVVYSGVERSIVDFVKEEEISEETSLVAEVEGEAVELDEEPRKFADNVHFEFDKFNISIADQQMLDREIAAIENVEETDFLVSGFADERGTEEYNQQLGDKRANAVREYLELIGVPSENIVTISYGELRPIDPASTEEAWKVNRRAEVEVTPF